MNKIPTLFLRDPEHRAHLTRDINPAAAWVLDGDAVPTRKFDGTCVMLDDTGSWWARREVKPGKATPPGYQEIEHDPATGKTMGWEPLRQSAFAKVFATVADIPSAPGTYELLGPKINGNPEGLHAHHLVRHGASALQGVPLDYDGLASWLAGRDYEGIVWHHPDGRMAKLKWRDFPEPGNTA